MSNFMDKITDFEAQEYGFRYEFDLFGNKPRYVPHLVYELGWLNLIQGVGGLWVY